MTKQCGLNARAGGRGGNCRPQPPTKDEELKEKKILGRTTLKGDTLMICKAHKMLGHLQIIRTSFPQQLPSFRNSTRFEGTSEHTS